MSIDLTKLKKFLNKEDTYASQYSYFGSYIGPQIHYPATVTKVNKVSFILLNKNTGEEVKVKIYRTCIDNKNASEKFVAYRSNIGYGSPITIWSNEKAYRDELEYYRLVKSIKDFVIDDDHEDLPLDRLREIYKLMKEVQ